ncbi:SOS response-associated peptidase [Vibrio europaeus]|uniref:Abasic site processing protein n=1 Tax=Vibrio europaeus TaxID=300876 RepID=A0AAE7AYK5_9VIBR|nr:SOS response-associated peptidase family protein [Vibrio europaeus]MDC5805582.1 SOS response-associated peptidase [Vibrio europaeus]MDC5811113.1 SOS response-associated peptidase [Vibrio europaeus]MDC5826344.1 SOS response-associated peptidase [Vibrio europaeus]MDC5831709.1 SOS response-associated peptidase [Vibrio europaeus]MDC5834664.1 SOS response-associated peptidase [Vibrio europaeus]
MCGRLNVIDDPLCNIVCEQLGLNFYTHSNNDLRPTEQVACIASDGSKLQQGNLAWGIKPDWAKRVIINAQAETVSQKPTFASSFQFSRVIVPCSGWYEWREEHGQKVKYLFEQPNKGALYMAAIALENNSKVVTLTTKPNPQCAQYHHRMPLLIEDDHALNWVTGTVEEAHALLNLKYHHTLVVYQ